MARCAAVVLAGMFSGTWLGGCQSNPPTSTASLHAAKGGAAVKPPLPVAGAQVATPDSYADTFDKPDTVLPRELPGGKLLPADASALAAHTSAFADSISNALAASPRRARPAASSGEAGVGGPAASTVPPLPAEAKFLDGGREDESGTMGMTPRHWPGDPAGRAGDGRSDDGYPSARPTPMPNALSASPAANPFRSGRRADRGGMDRLPAPPEPTVVPVPPSASDSVASANRAIAIADVAPDSPALPPGRRASDASDYPRDVRSGGRATTTTDGSREASRDVGRDGSRELVPESPREGDGSRGPAAPTLDTGVSQRLRDNPREVWAHLDFQMSQFLKDLPVPQLEPLAPLASEDREILSAIMDGLTNFRNALRADNNMLPSRKVRPILELADRLRAQADLMIPTIALCTRVEGFGVYEPIEPARFEAGRDHKVLVYCEVENFASQINEKKLWETRLSQEATIFTETGMMVWQEKAKAMVDSSRNRRHDFYVVKLIKLPASFTLGRYLLKVTITDQQAHRVAEATTPIQIVAMP